MIQDGMSRSQRSKSCENGGFQNLSPPPVCVLSKG